MKIFWSKIDFEKFRNFEKLKFLDRNFDYRFSKNFNVKFLKIEKSKIENRKIEKSKIEKSQQFENPSVAVSFTSKCSPASFPPVLFTSKCTRASSLPSRSRPRRNALPRAPSVAVSFTSKCSPVSVTPNKKTHTKIEKLKN